jgi:hypothetical protein
MTDHSITSPYSDSILAHLAYQGSRNDCGPCSAATVINGLIGANVDPLDLAQEMNKPRWHGPLPLVRRIPDSATFPWGMTDVFRSYGLQASWKIMTPFAHLLNTLQLGALALPIIGSWNPTWAHIMTLIQYDPQRGLGFANTQYPQPTVFWMSEQEFKSKWRFALQCVVEVKNA